VIGTVTSAPKLKSPISSAASTAIHSETIAGLDVMWQVPTRAPAKGLLLLFHGCSHSASDFFECEDCLGLPEERTIVVESLEFGLAVASISSGDRHFSRCWSRGDIAPTIRIIDVLQTRLLLLNRPLFAIGASSGGGFVGKLVTAMKPESFAGVSSQIMGWGGDVFRKDPWTEWPPAVEFVTMTRDSWTDQTVRENVDICKKLGVTVSHRKCPPLKMSPTFFSDRTKWASAKITEETSAEIYRALLHAGFVDKTSSLLLEDPRDSDWRMLLQRFSPAIEGIEDVQMGPDESAISEVMNVAWAMHEISSGDIAITLEFFRRAAGEAWEGT